MARELTDEEAQWLNDNTENESHTVGGGENLAACDTCEWTAQADTFDYLMEQVSTHLSSTFAMPTAESLENRKEAFIKKFGWDPWEEGVLCDEMSHLFDMLDISISTQGDEGEWDTWTESLYKDMGPLGSGEEGTDFDG